MPRKPRVVVPGMFYHVTQRGNHQQAIFTDHKDRIIYLKLMEEFSQKWGLEIYAYCLMPNHVHFIVKPLNENSLSRGLGISHQRYSAYFNTKLGRTGHLWQNRYFSACLDERHFMAAVRYVECNPLRAGMISKPWEYAWSSAGAHVGGKSEILTLGDIFALIEVPDWRGFLMEGGTLVPGTDVPDVLLYTTDNLPYNKV